MSNRNSQKPYTSQSRRKTLRRYNFRESHESELAEGRKYREAMETRKEHAVVDLPGRIQVLSGYGGDLLIRAVDDSRSLVTPDAYLKQGPDGTVDSRPKRTSELRVLSESRSTTRN